MQMGHIQRRIQGKCAGGALPPLLYDDMQHSNTTGILKRENLWFIGVEVK